MFLGGVNKIWRGGGVTKKYDWGVREKNNVWGVSANKKNVWGGVRDFFLSVPPEDFKWNSPNLPAQYSSNHVKNLPSVFWQIQSVKLVPLVKTLGCELVQLVVPKLLIPWRVHTDPD